MKKISLEELDWALDQIPAKGHTEIWIADNWPTVSFPGRAFWGIPGAKPKRVKAALKALLIAEKEGETP